MSVPGTPPEPSRDKFGVPSGSAQTSAVSQLSPGDISSTASYKQSNLEFAEFLLRHHSNDVDQLAGFGPTSLSFDGLDAASCRRYIATFKDDFTDRDLHLRLSLPQLQEVVKCHFETLVIDPYREVTFLAYLSAMMSFGANRRKTKSRKKSEADASGQMLSPSESDDDGMVEGEEEEDGEEDGEEEEDDDDDVDEGGGGGSVVRRSLRAKESNDE